MDDLRSQSSSLVFLILTHSLPPTVVSRMQQVISVNIGLTIQRTGVMTGLSNLATITQGIAELRNQYGTVHGKSSKAKGLTSRHAKLAVGSASTLAVFFV
jgi:hypothetical protein